MPAIGAALQQTARALRERLHAGSADAHLVEHTGNQHNRLRALLIAYLFRLSGYGDVVLTPQLSCGRVK